MNGVRLPFLLLLLLALPPLRTAMESRMTVHMLGQIPLLLWVGWSLASRVHHTVAPRVRAFNPGGAPGLLLVAAMTAALMIPRALDLSATSPMIDAWKFALLLLAGALLRWSWTQAGAPGQAFFVGNVTWMMAVVGVLLRDAPARVCTSYLVQDQRDAGTGLLCAAVIIGVRWVVASIALPTDSAGAIREHAHANATDESASATPYVTH